MNGLRINIRNSWGILIPEPHHLLAYCDPVDYTPVLTFANTKEASIFLKDLVIIRDNQEIPNALFSGAMTVLNQRSRHYFSHHNIMVGDFTIFELLVFRNWDLFLRRL